MEIKRPLVLALAVLAICAASALAADTKALPHYDLFVRLAPETGLLQGTLKLRLPQPESKVDVRGLGIESLTLNGKPLKFKGGDTLRVPEAGLLELTYSVRVTNTTALPQDDPENTGVAPEIVINKEGAYLMAGWYPLAEGLGTYALRALVPYGMKAVSEADSVVTSQVEGSVLYEFSFPNPVDHITLVSARYAEHRAQHGTTELYCYMLADRDDKALAQKYLSKTAEYLTLYEELLGPYPYKRFSVVENALSTGYSMPTYTLLGSSVMRLPFILETSLGHEVLHQWFGNGVYLAATGGNWTEGLTSFLADHRYDELKGEGPAHRKKLLMDYRSFVNRNNEISLAEFRGRTDHATRSIGYGKGAMVFHMLRTELGEAAFREGLRGFVRDNMHREAGWTELRLAFESAAGKGADLGWFFDQWVTRKAAPELDIKDSRVLLLGGRNVVRFDVVQRGPEYKYTLPVSVVLAGGKTVDLAVRMEARQKRVEVPLGAAETPEEIVIDAGYDLMRPLGLEEASPVIATLLGAQKKLVVAPVEPGLYQGALGFLKERGFGIVNAAEARNDEIREASVLVLGTGSPLIHRIMAGPLTDFPTDKTAALVVYRNPLSDERAFAVLNASSAEDATQLLRKMFRYGKYSSITFKGGTIADKSLPDSEAGLRLGLVHRAVGYRVREALSLSKVIEEALASEVVFVGEAHTNYEHHKVQLEFLRAMRDRGYKFAIGMEMFDRTEQAALDEYVAGKLTEQEFLRKSEYFDRWSYNYHHYREILDYARTHGIPVVALNQPGELVSKVSRGGLDALGAEDRKAVPEGMDLSDQEYRRRLKEIFSRHEGGGSRRFEYFYEAQVLWDETMAHSIAQYMGSNPGTRMLVITGQGHTMFRSGIPKRVERLTGKRGSVVIHSDDGVYDAEVADYVLFAEPQEEPALPALGIRLGPQGPQGPPQIGLVGARGQKGPVEIADVQPGSPADKAGMLAKDIVLSVDGLEVKSVGDLKASLVFKAPGETIEVKVRRKRFILSDLELTLKAVLP